MKKSTMTIQQSLYARVKRRERELKDAKRRIKELENEVARCQSSMDEWRRLNPGVAFFGH